MNAQQVRISELGRLQDDLAWENLDLEPTRRRLDALATELKRADTPEQQGRRAAYETAQEQLFDAKSGASQAQQHVGRLNRLWAAVQRAQDAANDIGNTHEPLTADEFAAAASLRFKEPDLDKLDLSGRDADSKTDGAVRASYLDAARLLEEQIQARDEARAAHEGTLLVTIRGYRNIDDRTHRQVNDTIDSLPALEHIHQVRAGDLDNALLVAVSALYEADRRIEAALGRARGHGAVPAQGVGACRQDG